MDQALLRGGYVISYTENIIFPSFFVTLGNSYLISQFIFSIFRSFYIGKFFHNNVKFNLSSQNNPSSCHNFSHFAHFIKKNIIFCFSNFFSIIIKQSHSKSNSKSEPNNRLAPSYKKNLATTFILEKKSKFDNVSSVEFYLLRKICQVTCLAAAITFGLSCLARSIHNYNVLYLA